MIDDSKMIRVDGVIHTAELPDAESQVVPPGHMLVRDEVDEQLLPLLLEEASEFYPKILTGLHDWRAQPAERERITIQLQRCLHTFKGSARMAGAMRLGELLHSVEGKIEAALRQEPSAVRWAALDADIALIGRFIEELSAEGLADMLQEPASGNREAQPAEHGAILPFGSVAARLYRVVRQAAKELGKRVNLEISGMDVFLDAETLERMTAPLEHLLRNAVAHGIELPELRSQAGKPVIGEIALSVQEHNGQLEFRLFDDGGGLDMVRLERKAIELGRLAEGTELDAAYAVHLILTPGVSTAPEVSAIAGRGIGLDIVNSEVSALGGSLEVSSISGRGLGFTIRLPVMTR